MTVDWESQEAGFRYVSHALSRMRREPPPPWLARHADEPEHAPAATAALAAAFADRWLAADRSEREVMRDEASSFTPEMREAVNAAVVARKQQVSA